MMTRTPSSITRLQRAPKLLRAFTALISIVLIFSVFTTPAFADGVEQMDKQDAAQAQKAFKRIAKANEKAAKLLELLSDARFDDDAKSDFADDLSTLRDAMQADDDEVLTQLHSEEEQLRAKGVAAKILARHTETIAKYKSNRDLFMQGINQAIRHHGSVAQQAVAAVSALFEDESETGDFEAVLEQMRQTPHRPFKPEYLTDEIIKADPDNKPKASKADFVMNGLVSNPQVRMAALGDFTYADLPSASNPVYLAETDEIVLSDAIKAKAQELGYDPVKIYDFIYNNVEFIPTWGAVQSAELTLGARRGNAFDIASLHIALLRASKIPARYVHGVIEVPADAFMNWVGGFESIHAATSLAGSGGIPLSRVNSAGRVTAVQMEHIWVEAAADYHPSRGARNYDADTWLPMDASFTGLGSGDHYN